MPGAANPYDFYALRYVFAGAEAVREETRRVWSERFGKRILEGYGVTECSPVIAVNTPMHFKAGTVGRLLPLIEHRLDPVAGIDEGGRLLLRGPEHDGRLSAAEAPASSQPPEEGWHDTGDIVRIDAEGFVDDRRAGQALCQARRRDGLARGRRADRRSRPTRTSATPSSPCPIRAAASGWSWSARRRESSATRWSRRRSREGLPEIAMPRDVVEVAALPLLGSGKTDYAAVQRLVEEAAGPRPAADPEGMHLAAG